jgi:hypothetical protein
MPTCATTAFKIKPLETFQVKGEDFLIFKKEHVEELITLFQSILTGEHLLKKNATRSFQEFLATCPKFKK